MARKPRTRRPTDEPLPPIPDPTPEPEPPLHRGLRRLASTIDTMLAHLRRLALESDRINRTDLPRWRAWHETIYAPARDAASEAWDALHDALAPAGYAALIAGGRLYYRNAGRDAELAEVDFDPYQLAREILRAELILDIDAGRGDPAWSGELRFAASIADALGWQEVQDRMFFRGRYTWINEAISRFGHDAITAGRVGAVLLDAPPAATT